MARGDDVNAATSAEEVTALLQTLDAYDRRAFKINSAALPKDPAAGQLDCWKQRVDALASPTAKELVAKLQVYHEAALKGGGLDVDSRFAARSLNCLRSITRWTAPRTCPLP